MESIKTLDHLSILNGLSPKLEAIGVKIENEDKEPNSSSHILPSYQHNEQILMFVKEKLNIILRLLLANGFQGYTLQEDSILVVSK